jgi:hypothetical protein
MSLARNMRRRGLAQERREGTRRRLCPNCGGLLLIRDDGRFIRHAKPECAEFKALSQAMSISNEAPGAPVRSDG